MTLEDFWARYAEPSGQLGPDYWQTFAQRLADLATIPPGAAVLDVGTYDGNVLLEAMRRTGPHGYGVGIDIYGGGLGEGMVGEMTIRDHRVGAMFVLSMGIIWMGRAHWAHVVRCMFGSRGTDEDRRDGRSGWLFVLGCLGVFLWLVLMGRVQWWWAAFFVFVAFLGGYVSLYIAAAVIGLLGAVFVTRIRSVA